MSTTAALRLPITRDEFSLMLRKAIPPTGWPQVMAIANSGGSDSTCLAFLLHRHLRDSVPSGEEGPQKLVSITIDHGLQPSSADMAQFSSKIASRLKIGHITSEIPWGKDLYPLPPHPGRKIEQIARTVRYRNLFDTMQQVRAQVLAVGHHADDQVETSIMRIARSSTIYGAGGMRPCRRWGMGAGRVEGLEWYGLQGMNTWIVRPLIAVSKDRILATCEANKLEYITDVTNFQPHITLRNAIRLRLNAGTEDEIKAYVTSLPPEEKQLMKEIDKKLPSFNIDINSGPEQLRNSVSYLSSRVAEIDQEVDTALQRCRLPSAPGTLLLNSRQLMLVNSHPVKLALLARVLRYVSFYPWGSLQADGKRNSSRYEEIIKHLWCEDPTTSSVKSLRSFVAGGGVLWSPAVFRRGGVKFPINANDLQRGDTLAWLASRQPPLHRTFPRFWWHGSGDITSHLHIDITGKLIDAIKNKAKNDSNIVNVLYDCRFLISFDISRMPHDFAEALKTRNNNKKITIEPYTKWYWPRIMDRGEDVARVIHNKVAKIRDKMVPWGELDDTQKYSVPIRVGHSDEDAIDSAWITVQWARPLDSL